VTFLTVDLMVILPKHEYLEAEILFYTLGLKAKAQVA
jgi:hypothetical protein